MNPQLPLDPIYRPVNVDGPLSQGDVLRGIHPPVFPGTNKSEPVTVLVLSHGCEIDKLRSKTCLVAEVLTSSIANPSIMGTVRRGKVANALHLPGHAAFSGDAFVHLSNVFQVQFATICAPKADALSERKLTNPLMRVAALSELGLTALSGRLYQFFARDELKTAAPAE